MDVKNLLTGILITLVLSGVTVSWFIENGYTTLYRDGKILARERWHVEAERTWKQMDYKYQEEKCLEVGGEIREYENSPTRCYYPDDYYEQLSRSLIRSTVENEDGYIVKDNPFFMYGTRGSYAGHLYENFFFRETDDFIHFPHDYFIEWLPRDTRNYKAVWRVWEIDGMNLHEGIYHDCEYTFGNVKIEIEDCDKLDYAEVKDKETIWFYFKPERGDQKIDVKLVDPIPDYTIDGDTIRYNIGGKGEITQTPHTLLDFENEPVLNFTSGLNYTQCFNVAFLFNINTTKPTSVDYWTNYSHKVKDAVEANKTFQRDCHGQYNINYGLLDDTHAWCNDSICLENVTDNDTENCYWEHDFYDYDTNSAGARIYWNRTVPTYPEKYYYDWKNINNKFNTHNLDFEGWNKGYYITNLCFEPFETKTIKPKINVEPNLGEESGKFGIYMWKYGDTIQESWLGWHIYLDPWFNTTFKSRRLYTFTENSNKTLTNYNVVISNFNCSGNTNATGSDIRVVNSSGSVINHAQEKNGADDWKLTFKLDFTKLGTNTVYVYCNNKNAAPANSSWDSSEGRYVLYDDFDDISGWTWLNESTVGYSVSSSEIGINKLNNGNSDQDGDGQTTDRVYLYQNHDLGSSGWNYTCEGFRWDSDSSDYCAGIGIGVSNTTDNITDDFGFYSSYVGYGSSVQIGLIDSWDAGSGDWGTKIMSSIISPTKNALGATGEVDIRSWNNGTYTELFWDGSKVDEGSLSMTPRSFGFGGRSRDYYKEAYSTVWCDKITLHAYVEPEPTYTTGDIEIANSPNVTATNPNEGGSEGSPVTFSFTPNCFVSGGCKQATLYFNETTNISGTLDVDSTTEWNAGTNTNMTISDGSISIFEGNSSFPSPNGTSLWQYEEGAGNAIDEWSDGADGTITGATYNATTHPDGGSYSLFFDGSGDYVDYGYSNALDGLQSFTVMAWVYLNSIDSTATLSNANYGNLIYACSGGSDNKHGFGFCNNEDMCLYIEGNGQDNWNIDANLTTGQWYHVAYVLDSSSNNVIRFYLDGKMISEQSDSGVDNPDGCANTERTGYSNNVDFDGNIDDLRIYKRVLTNDEVKQIHTAGNGYASGNYTSDELNAGRTVNWNTSSVDNNTAKYEIEFGENTTGSWNYSSDIANVKDSQFLKFKLNITDNTGDASIDEVNVSYYYDYDALLSQKTNTSVITNASSNDISYDFSNFSLPQAFRWKIEIEDSDGATSSSEIYNLTVTGGTDTAPTYSLNSTNSTVAGTDIEHRLKWEDDVGLSSYIFSFCNGTWNGSVCGGISSNETQWNTVDTQVIDDGTATNASPTTEFGATDRLSILDDTTVQIIGIKFNNTLNSDEITDAQLCIHIATEYLETGEGLNITAHLINETHKWTEGGGGINGDTCESGEWCWNNLPTSNLLNETNTQTISDGDSGFTCWDVTNGVSFANSKGYENISFYLNITAKIGGATGDAIYFDSKEDGTAANRPYMNITQSGSGGWVNDSVVSMTGTGNWSNVTKTINSTVGATIAWKIYANDTSDNWNTSQTYTYTTTSGVSDTCSCPASGDWNVDCTDNCIITSDCSIGANDLILTGSGTFTIKATITAGKTHIQHGCNLQIEQGVGRLET